MENKRRAMLALVVAAALVATAGGAYAASRPETSQTSPYSAAHGSGVGPWMMGMGAQQEMSQYMQQGYQAGNYQHMWNCSQQYDPQYLHQFAYNNTSLYAHEYLWNYCNSTGGT